MRTEPIKLDREEKNRCLKVGLDGVLTYLIISCILFWITLFMPPIPDSVALKKAFIALTALVSLVIWTACALGTRSGIKRIHEVKRAVQKEKAARATTGL